RLWAARRLRNGRTPSRRPVHGLRQRGARRAVGRCCWRAAQAPSRRRRAPLLRSGRPRRDLRNRARRVEPAGLLRRLLSGGLSRGGAQGRGDPPRPVQRHRPRGLAGSARRSRLGPGLREHAARRAREPRGRELRTRVRRRERRCLAARPSRRPGASTRRGAPAHQARLRDARPRARAPARVRRPSPRDLRRAFRGTMSQSDTLTFDAAIVGGRVVVPGEGISELTVGIRGETIAALLDPGVPVSASETIDASGRFVLPGVIDPHTHIGYEGYRGIPLDALPSHFETETASALVGGVTTLLCTYRNAPSYEEIWDEMREAGESHSRIDFGYSLGITN